MSSEAEAVEKIVRTSALQPELRKIDGGPGVGEVTVAITPSGVDIVSVKELLDEYRTRPERRKGTATLTSVESLIEHVNRFKDEGSAIFVSDDPKAPRIVAVIDYDHGGPEATTPPRFGTHRARYDFPMSDAWKAWTAGNKAWMTLEQFALFLEERLADVLDTGKGGEVAKEFATLYGVSYASPSKLLETSKGISIKVGQSVVQVQNLQSGETEVRFEEKHESGTKNGGPVKIPGAFLVGIPVFRLGQPFVVPARLRYRHVGGAVSLSYDLHRVDAVFEEAIAGAIEDVEEGTSLPVFRGSPEV
jgi:uncharacterized protein YfdQ (DUF2303 family)